MGDRGQESLGCTGSEGAMLSEKAVGYTILRSGTQKITLTLEATED